MQFTAKVGDYLSVDSELAVMALFEGEPLPEHITGLLEPSDFSGKAQETMLLYPKGGVAPRRLLLAGLGKRADMAQETLRQLGATVVKQAKKLNTASFTVGCHGDFPLNEPDSAQAFAEGVVLGAYEFSRYQTSDPDTPAYAVDAVSVYGNEAMDASQHGLTAGQVIAQGVTLARDLVNTPGSDKTPAKLSEIAVQMGERTGVRVTVLDKEDLVEQGFGGILAVGQGSVNEPRFIIMEHGTPSDSAPTICLVGKGITFDSGGLSIKPADSMENMKNDMGGAAAVIGAMQAVAELELPIHVVGLVSAAENMPSGTAYRPGDIIKTLSGKTVEVLNTDAEGRIVLSDAIHYAHRYEPDAIIEFSTLTGAMIIALGSHATGLMATDQALADKVTRAGEASNERVWQLPLWQPYHDMIKSKVADIKNLGGRPAGSITAGAFLAAFAGDIPFVHLDIAGTAWKDNPSSPYESAGGTGMGVRLVTQFLRDSST